MCPVAGMAQRVPVRDLSLPSRPCWVHLSHCCLIRAHASPKCKSNLLSQQGPHLGCRNLHTPPPFSWLPRGRELFLLPSAGELARGCTQPGSHFRPAQPAGTQEHFLALTQRLSSCHKTFPPPQSTRCQALAPHQSVNRTTPFPGQPKSLRPSSGLVKPSPPILAL